MAMALKGLIKGLGLGSEFMDYATAFISGAIDGALLAYDQDWIFLIKNIGIPVASVFTPIIPKGMKDHAVGQLGLLATLLIFKR